MSRSYRGVLPSSLGILLATVLSLANISQPAAMAFGMVTHVPVRGVHTHQWLLHHSRKTAPKADNHRVSGRKSGRATARSASGKSRKRNRVAKKEPLPPPPQDLVGKLSARTLAPGVVYKFFHGPLNINVIDVNMTSSGMQVRPVLAGETFSKLCDVKNHARQCQALAAVNANYFKKDGTPLGTLIIDKEWVAGPIFDRVSLGINKNGYVRIDRVSLGGILKTSSPSAPTIWVNNINQPRRHGSRLILYTRRWGNTIRMPYAGCLVAIDAHGKVAGKTTTAMSIPPGGFVLSDTKSGQISQLHAGDLVRLTWRTRPENWADVEQAVSGGPMLIKDGELYVDLKAENFRKAWTGRQIHARTAAGVTAYNHLLLVTIEGSHTLWDFAKFLKKLGAEDAMNLDGGGSTTMVVEGNTVTKNANSFQRRVASSLAVIDPNICRLPSVRRREDYVPTGDVTSFSAPDIYRTGESAEDSSFPELPAAPVPDSEYGFAGKDGGEPLSANSIGNIVLQSNTPAKQP